MDTDTFTRLYGEARVRVLTRYAAQAREHAAQAAGDDPDAAAYADGLNRYANACEAAAADLSLPLPSYPLKED